MKIIKTGLKDINNVEIKTENKLQWTLKSVCNNKLTNKIIDPKPQKGTVTLEKYSDGEGYYDIEHYGFIVKITKNKRMTLPDTLIFKPKIIN